MKPQILKMGSEWRSSSWIASMENKERAGTVARRSWSSGWATCQGDDYGRQERSPGSPYFTD